MSVRRSKLINNLAFLKRCRDSNLMPHGLRLQDPVRSRRSTSILQAASSALLKERISSTRSSLAGLDHDITHTERELQSSLHPRDFSKISALSSSSSQHAFATARRKQIAKFHKLYHQKQRSSISHFNRAPSEKMRSPISLFNRVPGQPTGSPISLRPPVHLRSQRAFQKHTVVNLSNRSITETETSVLSLGMNFAQPPKSIPNEEIIQSTEQALKHLSKTEKIDVRIKINEVLQKAKPAKSNLSKVEQAALREIRRDESIHILPADKGNATVIMDRTEYTDKVSNILSSGSYRPLPKDPTPSIEKRVASKLLSIHRSGALSVPLYRRLRPSSSTCPRFFGNPKIHKPEVPLRPIVASRGSPTYDTAKYLAKVLRPLVGLTEHHVSNSTQFVDITRNLTLQPTDILVSFDVESLFTNVPTDEACFLAKERLSHDPSLPDRAGLSPDQIHDLLYTCVSSSCFQFQGKYYEQTAGTSIGFPISPVLAYIFMEEFESSSLLTADLRPSLWLRYVDDTFVVWPHGQDSLHEFLQYLNQQHSSIKFTMEQEHSGKLPFLDVLITRNQDGTLHHSIYRKPTHTDRYLHQRSFHHPAIKSSVNRALVQRAYTICDPDSLQHELQHITTSLQRNGYNAKQVKTSKPVPPPRPKGLLYPRSNTHTHS
ncbi:uncharacterized protein [Asterias amurensis]|uniref:uncharacterized protein n=1 Tax=Asterias amurensis TaxID=7602 RepID=UPI003AB1DA02